QCLSYYYLRRDIPTLLIVLFFFIFFFNDTAPTEIYTLSLHDALPISFNQGDAGREGAAELLDDPGLSGVIAEGDVGAVERWSVRSEEHTSELQSRRDLVCRLLLEKKKKKAQRQVTTPNNSIHSMLNPT